MDCYNYPAGADTPNAPWNRIDPEPIEMEVSVIQTLSTTVKILVDDYEIDEDGNIDTSNCNLPEALEQSGIKTPYDLVEKVSKDSNVEWLLDDFQIIEE